MKKIFQRRVSLLIFFLVTTFLSPTASHAGDNDYCFGYPNFRYIHINTAPDGHGPKYPDFVCDDIKPLDELFNAVKVISPILLDQGILDVGLHQVDGYEAFDLMGAIIFMAYDKNDAASRSAAMKTFVHEIGHQILQTMIDSKYELFKQFKSVRIRTWNYQIDMIKYGLFLDSDPSCRDPQTACGKQAAEMVVDLKTKYPDSPHAEYHNALDRNETYFKRFISVAMPYHELFADIVATVYFGDPNVMQEEIGYFSGKDESCRSFSNVLPSNFVNEEPHCKLSLIRHDLWTQIIAPQIAQKNQLLLKVGQVFINEIQSQFEGPKLSTAEEITRLREDFGLK